MSQSQLFIVQDDGPL